MSLTGAPATGHLRTQTAGKLLCGGICMGGVIPGGAEPEHFPPHHRPCSGKQAGHSLQGTSDSQEEMESKEGDAATAGYRLSLSLATD